jgi:hypothetical protein
VRDHNNFGQDHWHKGHRVDSGFLAPTPIIIPATMDSLSSLSRTSSAASFSSTDDITPSVINASRRTRKRFTNVQLTMLETLFHRNSHPSREEREAVAKAGQMYVRHIHGP